jgi:cytochrome bd-type quinol oxidase subunit 2
MVDSPTRPDVRGAAFFVVLGHACFVATMLGCYAIEPSARAVRLGLSYYGNHLVTLGPYVTGFGLCITLTVLGLRRMRASDAAVRRLRSSVGVVTALMLPIPLTPYSVDPIFDWLHLSVVAVLFAAGYALAVWLVLADRSDRVSRAFFAVQTLAACAIVAAQFGVNDYMIPSELGFQLAVVGLVVRHLKKLAPIAATSTPVLTMFDPSSRG